MIGVVVLGSTGSIGESTLDVLARHPDRFRLVALNRQGQGRLSVPGLVGQEGDILHLIARRDALEELEQRLHNPTEGSRR